jgi:hypothetical protein
MEWVENGFIKLLDAKMENIGRLKVQRRETAVAAVTLKAKFSSEIGTRVCNLSLVACMEL